MTEQELLSQDEIDALMSMLPQDGSPLPEEGTETEVEEKAEGKEPSAASKPKTPENLRVYDFRRPDKFSKEQIRTLRMMHESMARRLSLSLSAHLRTSVDVMLADIDQGIYASFIEQMPSPAIFHIVSMKPLPGHVVFYMGLDLGYMMVDRLLGGPGIPPNTNNGREVSDLEVALLNGAMNKLLESLQEAWSGVVQLRPRVEDTALNLFFVNIALPSDPTVWVVFEIRVKQNAGTVAMGIPYSVLKPISSRLSPQTWIAAAEPKASESDEEHGYLVRHLQTVTIPVSVELGRSDITLEELVSLQEGDVLVLQTRVNDKLPVMVNQMMKFKAKPGQQGRRLVVQISDRVDQATS